MDRTAAADSGELRVKRSRRHRFLEERLEKRREEHRLRELQPLTPSPEPATVEADGQQLVSFSSNDYLGLSRHPLLKQRAAEYAERWGTGAASSRLVTGTLQIHEQVERRLAEFGERESALLFNSGFQANSTILPSLTTRHSLILADRNCHNSILQGAMLSRGKLQRFDHNSTDHLSELLERAEGTCDRILIVTETIFSMDGDRAPAEAIAALADRHDALLYVDDAHAAGVWGARGRGLAPDSADLVLCTCGKGFGSFGAYLLCSETMRSYLVNECSGFIYTTALPPPVIGAIDAALELIPGMDEERTRLNGHAERLRRGITGRGYDAGPSSSQIIPVITGSEESALALSDALRGAGMLATAIRPPTVPPDSSRLRITLTAAHTEAQIGRLLDKLGDPDG